MAQVDAFPSGNLPVVYDMVAKFVQICRNDERTSMMFNKPVGCAFLVEDNPDDVAIFEYAARRMDFPITLSKHKTGASARAEIADFVNRTEEQLPSLYILDISLSDMQGDVIFDSIAQAYRNRELDLPPIMFLTSAETPAAAHRVHSLGAIELVESSELVKDVCSHGLGFLSSAALRRT